MRNDEQSIKDKPLIIHGGAPITSQNAMLRYNKKIPVLMPFDTISKNKEFEKKEWWNYIFIDSGAFSVSAGNAEIKLNEYIDFIKKNKHNIDHYASLDVVTSGKESLENWKKMRKAKLFPIPVYHDGEPIDILKEYIDNCSYIGLGAVAYKSNKARMLFFDKIFDIYPDRSKIGFHGFGVMDTGLLRRYPWRSVDSSTVATISRFGSIMIGNDLSKHAISKRVNQLAVLRWKSEYKEKYIKDKFKEYGWSYKKAIEGTQDGLFERQFFNLDAVKEYIKIPNEFNPSLRLISLFD